MKADLTLTRVVFEYNAMVKLVQITGDLTLTRVVFELFALKKFSTKTAFNFNKSCI